MSDDTQRPDEREAQIRERDASILIESWDGNVRFLLDIIDTERAIAERAEMREAQLRSGIITIKDDVFGRGGLAVETLAIAEDALCRLLAETPPSDRT